MKKDQNFYFVSVSLFFYWKWFKIFTFDYTNSVYWYTYTGFFRTCSTFSRSLVGTSSISNVAPILWCSTNAILYDWSPKNGIPIIGTDAFKLSNKPRRPPCEMKRWQFGWSILKLEVFYLLVGISVTVTFSRLYFWEICEKI